MVGRNFSPPLVEISNTASFQKVVIHINLCDRKSK